MSAVSKDKYLSIKNFFHCAKKSFVVQHVNVSQCHNVTMQKKTWKYKWSIIAMCKLNFLHFQHYWFKFPKIFHLNQEVERGIQVSLLYLPNLIYMKSLNKCWQKWNRCGVNHHQFLIFPKNILSLLKCQLGVAIK